MLHWIPLIVAVLVSLTAAYLRLGLRTWTVATAIAIVGAGLLAGSHWLAILRIECGDVEIFHQRTTVMLADKILHTLRQTIFLRQADTIGDMANDDLGAGLRLQFVVRRRTVDDVFDKEVGACGFADVVIICAPPFQQRVGTDRCGFPFGHVCDQNGV